jgi:hypothetical protein
MPAPKPKLNHSAHTVELTIDLADLFGVEVPRGLGESIGTDIVDRIVNSVEGGKSPKGHKLKSYDKDYVDSDAFKAAGKSKNKVNMTLYGDMLGQMEVIRYEDSKVTLGWDSPTQNAKAYAHMTGFRGHPTIKNGTKREFFAVTDKMLDQIKEEYAGEIETSNPSAVEALSAVSIFATVNAAEESQSDNDLFNAIFGDDNA